MYIMYCNIERDIMKNQSGFPDMGSKRKISMNIFCSRHCRFFCFKNSFASNFYRVKTFNIGLNRDALRFMAACYFFFSLKKDV